MKALVISEDAKTLEFVDDVLSKNGMDIINYKWLIKALDNVEEINPDLIVVNVLDYPRHWKTLAQFVKTIFSNDISICLFVPEGFSGSEMKKARALEIDFCCHSQEEFEKCIKNFAQKKGFALQSLKKIYSEKDDSNIISVTELLQLLGKPFIDKNNDSKLLSAFELFKALEGVAKKSKSENGECAEKASNADVSAENRECTRNDDTERKTIESSENVGVDATEDESDEEIVPTVSAVLATVQTDASTHNEAKDDFPLPTVETLFATPSSDGDYVLPSTENLFGDEETRTAENDSSEDALAIDSECMGQAESIEDEAAATVSGRPRIFDNPALTKETGDYTLPKAENLFEKTNNVNVDEFVLPTAANLLETPSDDYVLPSTENLFDDNEITENESSDAALPHSFEGEDKSTEDEGEPTENEVESRAISSETEETEDYTLPTAEAILEKAEDVNVDEFVLPTAANLLETPSDDYVLPSTENLFEKQDAAENRSADVASPHSFENADESTEDEGEPTENSEDASAPSSMDAGEGIKGENNKAAHDIVEDKVIDTDAVARADTVAGADEVADTDASPIDAPVSDDGGSKTHFGSLYRLIQEKYEGK